MVYDAAGNLVGEKYATHPFTNDERMVRGEFAFRLNPGEHSVYCYTNTDSLSFVDTRSYETSAFHLLSQGADNEYMQPSDMFFHKSKPSIIHPGIINTDTTDLKRYTGRITVRFKNLPIETASVKQVYLRAERVATKQELKLDTLTTRMSKADVFTRLDGEDNFTTPSSRALEIDHRYLPSLDVSDRMDCMVFNFSFRDAQGEEIIELPVEFIKAQDPSFTPLRLLHGQRMILDVNNYLINNITIVEWDKDILDDGGIIME